MRFVAPSLVYSGLALGVGQCGGRLELYVAPSSSAPGTYAAMADAAQRTLEVEFFNINRSAWNMCVPDIGCGSSNQDWGADALTYALYFRWSVTNDPAIAALLGLLDGSGPTYGTCTLPGCGGWSDVPMWDSIAASREYESTGRTGALSRAKGAFGFVENSNAFALGACPSIDYQQPGGGSNKLKTLETDSNYIKAALLLYDASKDPAYLSKATAKYASVRQYFLDPSVPLYTVYVVDSGGQCVQIPRRFFGSVNGNMIWVGLRLAHATGDTTYRDQAVATAMAVDAYLNDPSGVYEDLQAENDVVEPLIEALFELATVEAQPFARSWLLRNATAATGDIAASGSYGRFFGGPAPKGTTTAWQANGGIGLAFAAGALAPADTPAPNGIWTNAPLVVDDVMALPATLTFTGSAIALFGSIGEQCCESGHARVFVDGTETFDQTGIWQNKSSSGKTLPNSVLFAWRWPSSGLHAIELQPGVPNGKEGTSFVHMQGYAFVK